MNELYIDKYYKQRQNSYSSRYNCSLIRNNANYEVHVDDNVDMPYINVYIDNHESKYFKRPKSSKYQKYSEIDRDSFNNYFNIALEVLKAAIWDRTEYYLIKYTNSYDLIAYAEDPKLRIEINVRNDLEITELSACIDRSFSYRPSIRKRGIPLSEEIFCFVFKESIKFIEDDCSYLVNRKDFWDRMSKAIKSEILIPSGNKTFDNYHLLIEQLDFKKKQIENHLIEKDTETPLQRATLRGEKEGINYAIKAIQKFFKTSEIID